MNTCVCLYLLEKERCGCLKSSVLKRRLHGHHSGDGSKIAARIQCCPVLPREEMRLPTHRRVLVLIRAKRDLGASREGQMACSGAGTLLARKATSLILAVTHLRLTGQVNL